MPAMTTIARFYLLLYLLLYLVLFVANKSVNRLTAGNPPTKLRTPQRNNTPQRNPGVTLGSETIRIRWFGADYQTSRKEMTRVLKPFDLQALSIFPCIKVALVTALSKFCKTIGSISFQRTFIKEERSNCFSIRNTS